MKKSLIFLAISIAVCIIAAAGFISINGLDWLKIVYAVAFIVFAVDGIRETVNLGRGKVPAEAEGLSARLRHGVIYEVVSSTRNAGNYIVLVQNTKTLEFCAIHVKSDPPKVFTLIAGRAIAVTR